MIEINKLPDEFWLIGPATVEADGVFADVLLGGLGINESSRLNQLRALASGETDDVDLGALSDEEIRARLFGESAR